MRELRCPGANCTFSIKTRSTHCYWLTWCSLVFHQVTSTAVRGSANQTTPQGRSRTPNSVSRAWSCVFPWVLSCLLKMINVEKTVMIPEGGLTSFTACSSQPGTGNPRWWESSLRAFHFYERPTLVPVLLLLLFTGRNPKRIFAFTKKVEKWKERSAFVFAASC